MIWLFKISILIKGLLEYWVINIVMFIKLGMVVFFIVIYLVGSFSRLKLLVRSIFIIFNIEKLLIFFDCFKF